jgi:hypothetical protein
MTVVCKNKKKFYTAIYCLLFITTFNSLMAATATKEATALDDKKVNSNEKDKKTIHTNYCPAIIEYTFDEVAARKFLAKHYGVKYDHEIVLSQADIEELAAKKANEQLTSKYSNDYKEKITKEAIKRFSAYKRNEVITVDEKVGGHIVKITGKYYGIHATNNIRVGSKIVPIADLSAEQALRLDPKRSNEKIKSYIKQKYIYAKVRELSNLKRTLKEKLLKDNYYTFDKKTMTWKNTYTIIDNIIKKLRKEFDTYVWLKHQSNGIAVALTFVEKHQEDFHQKEVLDDFVAKLTKKQNAIDSILQKLKVRLNSYSALNVEVKTVHEDSK